MCGIFGTIGYKISKEQFTHQLNKIKHRGPDGFGVWQSETGEVMLGHRRLAILDTDSRSNQPMTFDQRYYIVFNGEIYNYIELKDELVKKGEHFQTTSDTEVLLKIILREGPEALSKLNGMWSFVIYDNQERSLFISRDRLGKKPFYYIHNNERFAFASEMKSLYGCLNELTYNRSFIDYAVKHPFDNEAFSETLVDDIYKFPAGSYGILKNGKLEIKRYFFSEDLLKQKRSFRSFNDAVEQFRELFESSCRLRMRSDVPVGSALSGGIDSGYIVSALGKMGYGQKGDYKAVVASFPGSILDETETAMKVASHAGVNVIKKEIQAQLHPDELLRSVYDFEEIYLTAPVSFYQTYQSFRNSGVVVTLDGHGGDELFGGYPFDLAAKIKDDFPNIFKMKRTLAVIREMYGQQGSPRFKEVMPYFKSEIKYNLDRKRLSSVLTSTHYTEQLFHSTFKGILPTLLRNYDRYSMHAGVEVRMPFLDHRIVTFAFSIPSKYKIRAGFSKAIVRAAAKPVLPGSVLKNKLKSGWNSPMGEWLSGIWKDWLFDEIHSQSFRNCSLVEKGRIDDLTNELAKNQRIDQGGAQQLWLLLQPYLIEKANKSFAFE